MTTKIRKWGNSLAVRLPKKIVGRLNLREGSEVVVGEREQSVVIKRVALPKKPMGEKGWRSFVLPTAKRKENVSGKIDEILYGKSA